ncbi:hypothetical protein HPB52_006019 [Rhipicephalus sanguineus]|uniref:Uncharacterized protein n=1 Tax=Rhipicephalus sanguineus TaxID=34632 RepID=A0A9D4PVV8_RHISA|nr:hypothetical protein HPB52_006019 [Rhipicephalus sanguineus]
MKKQKFYRCACYLSSDIPVPELDMKINYVGRHAFVRQFGEVETTVFSRMNDVKEAQHSREQDDLNMCYIPFDEEVYKFKESCLDPEFVEVAKTVDSPESLPPSWIISKEKEVYRIPLFTREFAEKLLYELDHFESSEMPKIRPNVINNYAVTLNVCLGRRGFSGGELYFSDMREEPLDQCSSTLLQRQLPCHAFLHRGQQLRGALSTLSGEHVNLVVWLRSSEMRNRRCPLCDHVPTLVAAGEGYGDGFTARSPSQESAVLKFPKFPLHRLTSSSERMQPIDAQAQ